VIRVTFASYDDDPPLGGQGVVLHGTREALRRGGAHVHTVSGRGQNRTNYPRRTGRPPLDLSLQLNRNRLLLYRDEPDVIHAFGGPGGVLIWRPLLVPLVYTAHHTYRQAHPRRRVRRLLGAVEARAYRGAAMVLAVSPSTAGAVLAMGVPPARVEVLPPGIDVPALGGDEHEPGRLLFVGRLEPEKGVLEAVAVMEDLAGDGGPVQGVVIGAGSLATTVQRRAAASGGRIEYLGTVDAATLRREYARASLLLMPSRYEGLGLTALEAQAAGTPVVGFDVGGLRDAARAGGVLVPPGDTARLSAETVALLYAPARRAELGRLGREAVAREHSWDRVAARLQEIYRRVIAG
jgi:glycosyltransferase involved in cell wall biosynthesis